MSIPVVVAFAIYFYTPTHAHLTSHSSRISINLEHTFFSFFLFFLEFKNLLNLLNISKIKKKFSSSVNIYLDISGKSLLLLVKSFYQRIYGYLFCKDTILI